MTNIVKNTMNRRVELPAAGEYFLVNIFSMVSPLCLNITVSLGEKHISNKQI